MLRATVGAVALLVLTSTSAFAQGHWCASVDKAQVSALLGRPAPVPMPSGPAKDDDAGGVMTMCMYAGGGQKSVFVMRVEFASVQEAQKKVSAEYLKNQKEDDAKYVEEKGVGDRAFFAISSEGAGFTLLKGAKLYMVGIGGPGTNTAAQKPALMKLALSLAGS